MLCSAAALLLAHQPHERFEGLIAFVVRQLHQRCISESQPAVLQEMAGDLQDLALKPENLNLNSKSTILRKVELVIAGGCKCMGNLQGPSMLELMGGL